MRPKDDGFLQRGNPTPQAAIEAVTTCNKRNLLT